jgi:hypothetical protein
MTRVWLFLTVPVVLISIFVCIKAFTRLARPLSDALLTASVSPDVALDFPIEGGVALSLEGPRLTTKFRSLEFALIETATGQPVPSRNIWFRFTRSTLHRVRLEYRHFSLPRPGRYRLQVTGVQPNVDYSDCALVFDYPLTPSSPIFLPFLLTVAGAGLGLAGAIGGIVFSALILAGVWDRTAPAAPPSGESPAGRQMRRLTQERADASGWEAIVWAEQNALFHLPAGWRETARTQEHLACQSPDSVPVTLDIRVTAMSTGVPRETVQAALLEKAHADFDGGLTESYGLHKLGAIEGVLTIQPRQRGEVRLLVWEAYVGPPEKDRSVTLVFSAGKSQFDQMEPVLATILESVRIE